MPLRRDCLTMHLRFKQHFCNRRKFIFFVFLNFGFWFDREPWMLTMMKRRLYFSGRNITEVQVLILDWVRGRSRRPVVEFLIVKQQLIGYCSMNRTPSFSIRKISTFPICLPFVSIISDGFSIRSLHPSI
jgi:hypothetical protein